MSDSPGIVLATDAAIASGTRATGSSFTNAQAICLKNAVCADLRALHANINELATLQLNRLEAVEEHIRKGSATLQDHIRKCDAREATLLQHHYSSDSSSQTAFPQDSQSTQAAPPATVIPPADSEARFPPEEAPNSRRSSLRIRSSSLDSLSSNDSTTVVGVLGVKLPKRRQEVIIERPETPQLIAHTYGELVSRLSSPGVASLGSEGPDYFTAQIPLRVNGINSWALVDTGASLTIASEDLCVVLGITRLLSPSTEAAMGLGGNKVTMAGSAIVKFQIGSHVVFQNTHFTRGTCMPTGPRGYEFILGNDILQKLPKFQLDYDNGIFEMGSDRLPLGIQRQGRIFPCRHSVHVTRNTVIPPRSEAFVHCSIPGSTPNTDLVLLSQTNTLTDQDLVVAPAIFAAGAARLLVTNPTNEPKTLYANTTAATATELLEEDGSPAVLHYV